MANDKCSKPMCLILISGFLTIGLSVYTKTDEPLSDELTLIYSVYYGQKLYCKFGTPEEIANNPRDFQLDCYNKYKYMTHIKHDGKKTNPFLRFESLIGDNLKCETNIQNGRLLSCKGPYNVGTLCEYNCSDGYRATSTNVTCRLMKPLHNVTTKWWPADPCQLNEPSAQNVSNPGAQNVSNPATQTLIGLEIFIGIGVCTILVIVAVVLASYLFYKRKKSRDAHVYRVSNPDLDKPNDDPDNVGIAELPNAYSCWHVNDGSLTNNEGKYPKDVSASEKEEHILMKDLEQNNNKENCIKETTSLLSKENNIHLNKINKLNYDERPDSCVNLLAFPDSSLSKDSLYSPKSISQSEYGGKCSENVNLLFKEQSCKYRAKLRGELEVIHGRPLEQSLAGYIRDHWKELNFASENDVKVLEQSYMHRTDEKVSDNFLQIMSQHGYTIGEMLDYFNDVGADNVVDVVLEVHTNCSYCYKFRR